MSNNNIRYIKALTGYGEGAVPIKLSEDEQMIKFKVKVLDLPGPTRNETIYPVHEFKNAIEDSRIRQQLATGSLYGEHDHPINPQDLKRWSIIDMDNTSFRWNNLWIENDNELWGEVQTVPINGNKLFKCIASGEYPSFSVRVLAEGHPGDGGTIVLSDIILITIDWVRYPGNPDSFVKDSESFNVIDSPISEGTYKYNPIVAKGEASLIEKGFIAKDETLIPVGENGWYAVAKKVSKDEYQNLNDIRMSAF
nr:MAG TPA: Prohead core protein serine protease [Caudoviricetes sp.]